MCVRTRRFFFADFAIFSQMAVRRAQTAKFREIVWNPLSASPASVEIRLPSWAMLDDA